MFITCYGLPSFEMQLEAKIYQVAAEFGGGFTFTLNDEKPEDALKIRWYAIEKEAQEAAKALQGERLPFYKVGDMSDWPSCTPGHGESKDYGWLIRIWSQENRMLMGKHIAYYVPSGFGARGEAEHKEKLGSYRWGHMDNWILLSISDYGTDHDNRDLLLYRRDWNIPAEIQAYHLLLSYKNSGTRDKFEDYILAA